MVFRHLLDLCQLGFAPKYLALRDIADKLLVERGVGKVGVHWLRNFVKRTDCLTTRSSRSYDRQQALCEDTALI